MPAKYRFQIALATKYRFQNGLTKEYELRVSPMSRSVGKNLPSIFHSTNLGELNCQLYPEWIEGDEPLRGLTTENTGNSGHCVSRVPNGRP